MDSSRPGDRPRSLLPVARVGYVVIRTLMVLGLGLGALALSIVASVWGLSAVLVGAALVALVVARTVHRARTQHPSAARPRRAFVITAVFLVGFFVLLTLASQIWASH